MATLLWQLVRDTSDINLIDANISKLPTHDAVRCALMNDKLDIATHLINKGVPYDASKLKFRSAQSIKWAKQHNIIISLDQVTHYGFDLQVLQAIREHYPSLLQSANAFKCTDECLSYLLSNCNRTVDSVLVRYILGKGLYQSFLHVLPHISVSDYKEDIAKSSIDIVTYMTTNGISITELDMDLFAGLDIYNKLEVFSPQVPDFAPRAKVYNLLQTYVNDRNHNAALYLVEHYNMCINNMSPMDTAKQIIQDSYNELIEVGIGDEVTILRNKQQIAQSQYNSVKELIKYFHSCRI